MEQLQELLRRFIDINQEYNHMVDIFFIVLASALLSYFIRRSLNKLETKLQKTENNWDDAFVRALRRPAGAIIWVVGLSYAANVLFGAAAEIENLRSAGVVASLAWFALRFVDRVEANILESRLIAGKEVDRTTADAVAKIIKLAIAITALLVALQTLGISIAGILAFGGVGGIAIGFAAKDLLANFFGALMIYFDRPFAIGDWIRSPDRNIEGTVEKIGWRQCMIRTFDKRPLYIPNAVFSTIAVENPSRMSNRRINETIGVRYNDFAKLKPIVEEVRQMLVDHPAIDEKQTLMANVDAYGASSIDFFIYCFTHTTVWTEFHEIKEDVLLKIGEIIDKHGAEIAFPTRTLQMITPEKAA